MDCVEDNQPAAGGIQGQTTELQTVLSALSDPLLWPSYPLSSRLLQRPPSPTTPFSALPLSHCLSPSLLFFFFFKKDWSLFQTIHPGSGSGMRGTQ